MVTATCGNKDDMPGQYEYLVTGQNSRFMLKGQSVDEIMFNIYMNLESFVRNVEHALNQAVKNNRN